MYGEKVEVEVEVGDEGMEDVDFANFGPHSSTSSCQTTTMRSSSKVMDSTALAS